MEKVLAINSGSSSLKFKLFVMPAEEVIAAGKIERIGIKDSLGAKIRKGWGYQGPQGSRRPVNEVVD